MAGKKKNLSQFNTPVPDGSQYSIALIVAEWNETITYALRDAAIETLKNAGVTSENIHVFSVPGSYELPYGALTILQNYNIDAAICLGCVIQGETPHFDYICQAVAKGCMDTQLQLRRPVIFGVLTTLNYEQAAERAGGKHGNKGSEAAYTALKMIELTKASEEAGDRDPMMDAMNGPLGGLLLQSAMMNDDEDLDFELEDDFETNEDESYFGKGKKVELNPKNKKKKK